jgi:hypothetical protein
MSKALKSYAKFIEMRNETTPLLKAFADITYAETGSFSYAAGYYESLIGELLAEVPKATRARVIEQLKSKVAE